MLRPEQSSEIHIRVRVEKIRGVLQFVINRSLIADQAYPGAAQKRKLDVIGPMSADALFYYAYRGEYDAVVAMYHDQGQAPFKLLAFDTGVNVTLGLPFVRTSPDHGTAFDIAGSGRADPSSLIAAIKLAAHLAARAPAHAATS